jgi:hypothetical protein
MKRATRVVGAIAGALAAHLACGSNGGTTADPGGATDAGTPLPDGNVDAEDPRCATQAIALGTHPHAAAQTTPLGRTLADTRGWHGRLYFAYGDLEANTGPIAISSYEPKTKTWKDHPIAVQIDGGALPPADAFATHVIQRFMPIGDNLWAAAGQPDFRPFGPAAAPEYAIGTATHDWSEVDIAPNSIHVGDVVERAPNDIVVGGSILIPEPDAGPEAGIVATAAAWRSVDGGAFTQIFPVIGSPDGLYDRSGAWFYGAALKGVAYLDAESFIYTFDGQTWGGGVTAFGEFFSSTTFAGRLLFADLGQLYAFDGTSRQNLDFRFFESKGRYQGSVEPLAMFQATEGHLVAVNVRGDVMMTTDLTTWTCIGKAPADATSIGSLDGVIYFGAVESRVYGFESPSW